MLYGQDPRQPTSTCLSQERTQYMVDIDDYRIHLTCGLSECWKIASENVKIAQSRQKKFYDRNAKQKSISVGDSDDPYAAGSYWQELEAS